MARGIEGPIVKHVGKIHDSTNLATLMIPRGTKMIGFLVVDGQDTLLLATFFICEMAGSSTEMCYAIAPAK